MFERLKILSRHTHTHTRNNLTRLFFFPPVLPSENPDPLVLQSRPQGAGKGGGREETLLRLRDRVAARLSRVSPRCRLEPSPRRLPGRSSPAEPDHFSPLLPNVFRRQMAEALKKLNVPVTVVLDAAVG